MTHEELARIASAVVFALLLALLLWRRKRR
jgi:hypothetical protein